MYDTGVPDNLETIPAGVELGRVLASLDYEHLSEYDLVRVLQAQQRQVAHYQAAAYWSMDRLVSVYQDPDRFGEGKDLEWAVEGAAAEIGAALTLTRCSAEYETGFAVEVNRRLPRVGLALSQGQIDMRRARVIINETVNVKEATARDIVDRVLDDAATLTTGQLRARLQKLCIDANPDEARERYRAAVEDRRLVVESTGSGTANLHNLDMPTHVAETISKWIHKEALRLKRLGDDRTMDQLRSDIATDLLLRRHVHGKITRADFGILDMKVTAETLAGVSDESAELSGFGPVLADIAREVAEHQQHVERRWTMIDPDTKQPVDGGILRRKPTAAMRRKIETLHPTCIHPGCRMPSVDCDIDHRRLYSDVRVTCACDLGPMCRHHHVIRHTYGWSYQKVAGGDNEFTTPLGHRYTTSGRPARPP